MKRVLIIGSPGAGKSTFARELAARTGLPLIHLDDLYWNPGWVRVERRVWQQRLQDALGGEAWILDGNYPSTLGQQAQRADTVLLLTPPRALCLWRVIRRELSGRHPHRHDVRPKWPQWAFLRYTWQFPRRVGAMLSQLGAFPHLTVVLLQNDRDVSAFLRALP